jgi:hypothetical protein
MIPNLFFYPKLKGLYEQYIGEARIFSLVPIDRSHADGNPCFCEHARLMSRQQSLNKCDPLDPLNENIERFSSFVFPSYRVFVTREFIVVGFSDSLK